MSTDKALAWMWVEENAVEDPAIQQARMEALDIGAEPVSTATGAVLRMLVLASGAKAVAEIGTGAGVSGLWLLSGMAGDAVLTSIDREDEFQRAARHAFSHAGVAHSRTRLINGNALDVLPRMAKAAYDMVVIDGDVHELSTYVDLADKMLRPGGLIVIVHALWADQVCDPAKRDTATVSMRQVVTRLLESDEYITNIMPVGDGIAVAIKR
ncbi:MAG: O-methyltransferase [Actinomycetaceae bacterium]|nr:O-methyltransferase [Actinomycetaceae bacterium]